MRADSDPLTQYAALDKADPNNPDYLREWGKLILRDTSRPKEARQAEAERIWRRLLAARPADPLVTTQVADLFRHAGFSTQALELYEKAVELAPGSPQYREYLGEYYHILKRTDDALATWRQIAAGKLRMSDNLARLAEVFAQFGYLAEAQPEIAAACELSPKDFALHLKAADLQIRGEKYEATLVSLTKAAQLAQNDEEREAVLAQQIKTYTFQNKLADLAAGLDARLAADGSDPQAWYLLARYREALRQWPEASRAIGEALALRASDIPSLAAAARIAEQAGDLAVSADFSRKLAVVDRRSGRGRSEYPLTEKPVRWGEWASLRLVVKESTLTLFLGDKQVHSERLPMNFDPWLALRTVESHHLGSVRNARILGTPTIPREVRLFAGTDLAGGLVDYFGESIGEDGAAWTKRGEEVFGRSITNAPGSFRESLLQYHRPLAEGSEVQYEFYYQPGKSEVHPAIDRLVFVLRPEGPRLHWLTAGAYERTGLACHNESPVAAGAPVPLKSNDWNAARLVLAGSAITIEVNGQTAARRELEPGNLRTLGWFHYADAAEARIRNIVYRGEWPTELSAIERQELASQAPIP